MSIVPQEVDYKKISVSKPEYRMLRVNQQSGGTSVVLDPTASSTSVFELPVSVVNLSKSMLQFNIALQAQGAGVFGALITSGTVSPIRDIHLITQSGLRIATVPTVGKYLKVVQMTDTKLSDFLTMSPSTGFSASNAVGAADGNYALSVADNAAAALANARTNNTKGYVEPTGFMTSADNGVFNTTFRIPLSVFKNCILSHEKDLFFNEIVRFEIEWAPFNSSARSGTSVALAGQAVLAVGVSTVSSLYLYLAQQKNEGIARQIRDEVKSGGMKVLTDFIYAYNQNLTGTAHSLSFRWSRAHGRYLKRVYAIPYVAINSEGTNHFNHARDQAGEAVESLYTQLDNERIQQWNLDSTTYDEYLVMEDRLKGSVIQSQAQFNLNYFFCDSWDGLKFHEKEPNTECGLPLDVDHKYDIIATAEGARNWYVYAIVQRMLTVSSEGITLD